jgi:hypothetical protein
LPEYFDDFFLKVVERAYGFPARRFMSFRERAIKAAERKKIKQRGQVW